MLKVFTKDQVIKFFVVFFLCLSTTFLIGFQIKPLGFVLLLFGLCLLFLCEKQFVKYILLLYFSVFLLGITPISSDIYFDQWSLMILGMIIALVIPYLVSRFIYKDYFIKFPVTNFHKWSRKRIGYIFFVIIATYFLLSFYFQITNAYLNWPVYHDYYSHLTLLTIILVTGLWDELFFVCTFFVIFKKFLPFKYANIAQAVIFSAFLYQMGFRSWGYGIVLLLALAQGLVYEKTKSLTYLIAIHWTVDFVLFYLLLQYNS